MHNLEELRYPIGRFSAPDQFDDDYYSRAVESIRCTPGLLRDAVSDLSDGQLDTPYRPNGWTVRQVVHHVADSHINAYVRVKWALTEQRPTIKTYDEVEWANLSDGSSGEVALSLDLAAALHARWVSLLTNLSQAQRSRTITHLEWGPVSVDFLVANYAWHGEHHVAHITSLAKRLDW